MIEIVVTEADGAGSGTERAFHQAGVEIVIAEQGVAFFGQRRKRSVISLKTGAEDDRGFFVNEGGEFGFEFDVQIERAVQEARTAAAAAVLFNGLNGGFFDFGMRDEIQVVVGAEHEHLTAAHADLAGPAAFALAKDFEVHVESGGLEIARTREVPALFEEIGGAGGATPVLPALNDGCRSAAHRS